METTEHVTLSTEDVAAINAARTILHELAEHARYGSNSQNSGIIFELATQTEWAMFRVLSCMRTHMGVEISDDQIHNRS